MFIQAQLVTIVSVPSFKKIHKGIKLTKKASLTAVFTCEVAQCEGAGWGFMVVITGRIRSVITKRREDVMMVVVNIAITWICTKSFWFLRPMDGYYPLIAGGRGSPGV